MPDIKQYVPMRNIKEDLGGSAYDIYDFSVHGGAVSTINLPLDIPNNAVITRGFVQVLTAGTSGGSATVAFGLNTNTDLLAATAIASFSANALLPLNVSTIAAIDGNAQASGIANFRPLLLTAERSLKVTIATAALTAGKFAIYLEYAGPFNEVLPVTYGK